MGLSGPKMQLKERGDHLYTPWAPTVSHRVSQWAPQLYSLSHWAPHTLRDARCCLNTSFTPGCRLYLVNYNKWHQPRLCPWLAVSPPAQNVDKWQYSFSSGFIFTSADHHSVARVFGLLRVKQSLPCHWWCKKKASGGITIQNTSDSKMNPTEWR